MASGKKVAAWVGCGTCSCAVIITFIVLLAISFKTLEATEFGIRYNSYTKQIDKTQLYDPGTHFVGPSARFIKFPQQVIAITFKADSFIVRTLDGMGLNLGVSVQYKLSKQLDVTLKLLIDWGEGNYESVVEKLARDSIRNSAAKFSVDAYVYNRQAIDAKMTQELTVNLLEIGVSLQNFQLTDVQFPTSFQSVIRNTQQKQIEVTNTQNDREREIQQANGRLEKAATDASNYFLSQQSIIIARMSRFDAMSTVYPSFVNSYIAQLKTKESIYGTGLWYYELTSLINERMSSGKWKVDDVVPTPSVFKAIFNA